MCTGAKWAHAGRAAVKCARAHFIPLGFRSAMGPLRPSMDTIRQIGSEIVLAAVDDRLRAGGECGPAAGRQLYPCAWGRLGAPTRKPSMLFSGEYGGCAPHTPAT